MSSVVFREAPLKIPTYVLGEPEKNPIFYTGRTYQGAKGPVYPYPLLDKLTDRREDREYRSLRLENQYVQTTVLPEMGGRIFSAQDRTNGYDFVYRQHVIKPALIGMAGAWISGGAEWDLPHHHRASTFMTVDHTATENPDGSRTVWVGETELRHRMRWTVGITLYPNRSYIETAITLRNRTPLVNSFLCFTNLAVHVNSGYQVIFPPSTEFGVQHAKCEFIHWPVARGKYAGNDFTGVDVSWWKSHPNWISIFAWNHEDDFFGGYDHQRDTGIAHFADHHVAPGKKSFEFGNGTPGQMYDKILTEEDGPYVELMAGAYSDNQPDYSWIQPYEVKTVKQYWFPLRGLGGLKMANREGALNLELKGGNILFAANATTEHRAATLLLKAGDRVLASDRITIAPDKPYSRRMSIAGGVQETDLRLALLDGSGRELIAYQPHRKPDSPTPEVVVPPAPPNEQNTNEEAYLAGMRLEQFHSPAAEPEPYYQEVLRRDAGDARANTALGILYFRRGVHEKARQHLESSLARLTRNYTRARTGEPHYYLGATLRVLGDLRRAEDQFNRAAWDFAWRAASYHQLAELAVMSGDLDRALEYLEQSIGHNAYNHQARCLRALALRRLSRFDEAIAETQSVLRADPLDFRAAQEKLLALGAKGQRAEAEYEERQLMTLMRGEAQSHLELASDYAACAQWQEAISILQRFIASGRDRVDPMVHYTLGYYLQKIGAVAGAREQYDLAIAASPDYCFPSRLESIEVLRSAMGANPRDARAPYLLGNLLYDLQPQEAISCWERARELDESIPTVHRNLALAYARINKDRTAAIAELEKACACDPADAKLHYELDLLLDAEGECPQRRLRRLEKHHDAVMQRDDSLLREISLHILLANYTRAIDLLSHHHFHVWEGGESVAHDAFSDAHLLRGRQHFAGGRFAEALADFSAPMEYPERFELGRPHDGGRIAETSYLAGRALEAMGDCEKAGAMFEKATANKRRSTYLAYYEALALRKLGRDSDADALLQRLKKTAEDHLNREQKVDFFEKFGSREDDQRQRAHAHYLVALAHLGLGDVAKADEQLAAALRLNANHVAAKALQHREMRI